MNTADVRASAEFKTLAQLVASADAALIPLTVGRGVDSHGKPLHGLAETTVRALRDAHMAGQLAAGLLSRLGIPEESTQNPT